MRETAGLLIYCEGRVLLVKQKGSGTFSIPKGEVREGETHLQAAVRESEEECGIVIKPEDISATEYLCSIDAAGCRRKLFYYKAQITPIAVLGVQTRDPEEIEDVALFGIEEAISNIQTSQVALLWDGGKNINPRILNRLVSAGWVHVEKHPSESLYIYDYTEKCKREKVWNELTMWCRGLITDDKGDIVAYPLKKFFEYEQLFPECRNFSRHFDVSEKIDGFLGITYFIDGHPYVASRDSFTSVPAIKATALLYTKHLDAISRMNTNYTYLFEVIYPNQVLVLDYGGQEELILIDIIDNQTGKSVIPLTPSLPFRTIRQKPNTHGLEYYLKQDGEQREGLVLRFPDGNRLKIKFPWFKKKFVEKNGK